VFPFYSSRWRDLFSYGQVKTEMRLGSLPFRPYVSLRLIGDTRGATAEAMPQYLSESCLIAGLGVATRPWHGTMAWAEAGSAVAYTRRPGVGRMVPDYRGGVAFVRGFGHRMGAESGGAFFETNADALFVSRFQNDVVFYWQNRAGWTLPLGALRTQWYLNVNATTDAKSQYWANFVESGPGVRFRWRGLPESLVFSVSFVGGAYTRGVPPERRPVFRDFRAGFWYAFSR
jgi:hypothetical protein